MMIQFMLESLINLVILDPDANRVRRNGPDAAARAQPSHERPGSDGTYLPSYNGLDLGNLSRNGEGPRGFAPAVESIV